MTTLFAHSYSYPPVSGDLLGSRTLSLLRLVLLVEDSSNGCKVLGKYQSQCQLPTAVRRDGTCLRALGSLIFRYITVLSHLAVRCFCLQAMSPRSSCSTIITRVSDPDRYPRSVHPVDADACTLQRLKLSLPLLLQPSPPPWPLVRCPHAPAG